MAKLFGEIAAKSILTLDKSFARANGQPLDSSEIYYSLQAAQNYAKTDIAYIGQKIVVIENNKVTHYSIEDAAGTLKEVGSKPIGDTKTIKVATDGTVSLANIPETLKDEEGNDIPKTYNAVLVNGVLTWVEPSATTVEGLSDLIKALTSRVDTAEVDINKLESAVGVASKPETTEGAGDAVVATGLFKTVEEEIARSIAEDAAIREIAEGAKASIDTFLTSEKIDETVNTLKEIQAEIDKMTDATELATALSTKADTSYVNAELAKKQDVIADNTYDAYGSAAAVQALVEKDYATKEALKTTDDKTVTNAGAISALAGRVTTIEEKNGEPNVITGINVNGTAQSITDKTVNITVPTKFTDISDDSGFDARITAAQNKADQGVQDAATAQTKANEAATAAGNNATAIGTLTTTVEGHTKTIGEHATDIGLLKTFQTEHTSAYNTLNEIVTGHTSAIAKKAEQTTLDGAIARIATNETAIKTLNETTIPGINQEVGKKANSADVYTKTEIGTIAEGKTLVQMIEDAQTAATYDDTKVKADIKANADAIAILNGDAETAGSVAKVASDTAKAEVAAIVDSAPEAFDTLKEIATWIEGDKTATEALVARVTANEKAVSETLPGAIAQTLTDAKAYTDEKMVKADGKTIVNNNGTFSVNQVSTDMLVNGENTLILFGGSANVAESAE